MSADYIDYDRSGKFSQRGPKLATGAEAVRNGRETLNRELAVFAMLLSDGGKADGEFDAAVRQYGFGGWVPDQAVTDAQRAHAKAAWGELTSLAMKLNTPAGESAADVGPAIAQACAKLGV